MESALPKVIGLAIFGFIAWGIVRAAYPAVFTVRVSNGEPRVASGTVAAPFLTRLREVATEHRIATGRVRGVARSSGRISLKFSNHFPPAAQQQLRNWWAVSGWSAPNVKRSG